MVGKFMLLLMVGGIVFTVYNVVSWLNRDTPKDESEVIEQTEQHKPPAPRETDQVAKVDSEALPVLASSSDFILVEAWGIVRRGELMPSGETLEAWDGVSADLRSGDAVRKVLFRRPSVVMAQLARIVPTPEKKDE